MRVLYFTTVINIVNNIIINIISQSLYCYNLFNILYHMLGHQQVALPTTAKYLFQYQ